jgi:molybdopterin molybdotransferase
MMQEDAREEGGAVILPPGLKRGANCRPAGEDLPRGEVALEAGRRLGPADIGLARRSGCAAGGQAAAARRRLLDRRRTGRAGRPLGPAQTYDSNRFTLMALLGSLPAEVSDLGILPDDAAATARALAGAAASHDLLLTSAASRPGRPTM